MGTVHEYTTKSLNWSNKSLVRKYNKKEIDTSSAIQRGRVWSVAQKSLLIHSMLVQFLIPPITVVQMEGKDEYEVVDGKQRIEAIVDFYNGEYKLSKIIPPVPDEDGNEIDISGCYYQDLPIEIKAKLDSCKLRGDSYEGIADLSEKGEIFFRLNSGTPLTNTEKSISKAKNITEINVLLYHPLFEQCMARSSIGKLKQRNILIRSYMLLLLDPVYFDAKSIAYFLKTQDITQENVDSIKKIYDCILEIILNMKASDDEQISKIGNLRFKKIAHLMSVIHFLIKHPDIDDAQQFFEFFFLGEEGKASINDEYNDSLVGGMWKTKNVEIRINALEESYNNFKQKG